MPEVAHSRDGITILKVKTVMMIQLKAGHGHLLKGKFRTFAPWKLEVEAWRGKDGLAAKAKVTCYDIALVQPGGKRFPDQKRYYLTGYKNEVGTYEPVPKWIASVIREFGYQDPIDRIEGM